MLEAEILDNDLILEANIEEPRTTKELFFVQINETATQADKTSEEIFAAAQEGKFVVGVYFYNDTFNIVPFAVIDENNAQCQILFDTDVVQISIDNTGAVTSNNIELAEESDIPHYTSQLTNNSGFITNAVSDLLNYYTNWETYRKDEVYNKAEVQELISAIQNFKVVVVQTLPVSGEELTIYLVPRNPGELNNIYDEYLWIYPSWEKIGSTDIDLSNYYTKSETDTLINNSKEIVYVNIDFVNLTSDKTSAEIYQIAQSGKVPVAKVFLPTNEYLEAIIFSSNATKAMASFIMTNGACVEMDVDSSGVVTYTTTAFAKTSDVPTKTSDLTNDSGFIDNSVNNLTNYYTKDVNNSLGGLMMPDTTNMTPVQTIEYDVSSNAYFKIMSIPNNSSSYDDLKGSCLFRITTTGEGINHTVEGYLSLRQQTSLIPWLAFRNSPGNGLNAVGTIGIRYLRYIAPKALNNNGEWALEFACPNNTARHMKIEIFSTRDDFVWYNSLTSSTYNTTYETGASLTMSTTDSLTVVGNVSMTVQTATSANYISSYLSKFVSGTLPKAHSAISAQQFCFMNGGEFYPASNKTLAVEPGFGIQLCSNNVNANSAMSATALRQKYNNATLTNIPHATLTAGSPCWFRCTMDANGNILSDDYVATERTPGYTWYYVGMATSATAINTDTTQSRFYTLDANGIVTHVDGLPLASNGNGVSY